MGGGVGREQCGSNKRCTGSPLAPFKNLTTGLIWLVTRGGGWGEAWGGGPCSVGATKGSLFWAPKT